jgi:hypothetical protein
MMNDGAFTCHPAMLAMVTAPDGKPSTIHRTYLAHDARQAPVEKVRKLYSSAAKGSAIRLTPPAEVMGIAEGLETALAAARIFHILTWSALCADMLEQFEPPAAVKKLLILGDNDADGKGQRAAFALASRLAGRVQVTVQIPEKSDTDWNDVLGRMALTVTHELFVDEHEGASRPPARWQSMNRDPNILIEAAEEVGNAGNASAAP